MMIETQSNQPSGGATIDYLIVRKSAFFLATQLATIELVSLVVVILLLEINTLAPAGSPGIAGLAGLAALVIIIGLVAKLGLMLWVIMAWLNDYYEIRPKEIICHRGVIAKQRTIQSTHDVKSMSVSQDFLGRIFRYGDIKLFNPALDEVIGLMNIANPNKHLLVISQLLPELRKEATFIRTPTGSQMS